MISVSNLAKSYGDQILFSGVSFQLNAGERYGLVGANGSGKTTLLNILSGELEASEGSVSVPKRLRLGVLCQDQFQYEDDKILEATMMGNPELWEAMVRKEAVLARADAHFDADLFSELEETVQRLDGYTAEGRAAKILEGLGLPAHIHGDLLSTLSGGFKLRVLLAQVLAGTPDVLLLDEPTNHLDILSIRWLEIFLCDFVGPVVVISHDHRFLDNVTTKILDVDYESVRLYRGNYTDFVKAKRVERERREKDIASREREIAHHEKFVERFRAKASKARQAQSKIRMIEKKAERLVELAPSSRRYPTFRFDQVRDSGRDVLKVKGVTKSFGDNEVLHDVDLFVQRGERLAIMGPNGIGKSTLLKIVMGELKADEGEVEWGYETHPGYFAQAHRDQLGPLHGTAEGWVWDCCQEKDIGFVRSRMALMLFSGDDSKKKLSALSGGEVARLIFTRLIITRPNVLVLDEPTNHLDLESIEALVEGLQTYLGTIIFVSHDRWLVGRLATRVVEIRPEEIRNYHGTYEEYIHFCGDDHLDADRVILKAKTEKRKRGVKKEEAGSVRSNGGGGSKDRGRNGGGENQESPPSISKGRRKQILARQDELSTRIDDVEGRIKEIDKLFCEPVYYKRALAEEVSVLETERAALQREVTKLMDEWEQNEEEIER